MKLPSKNVDFSIEIGHLNDIKDSLIDNINLYDCFKNTCTLTTGYLKYNNTDSSTSSSSLAKCDTTQCLKVTIPIDSCEDYSENSYSTKIIPLVKYDEDNDALLLCDEKNQFQTITSSTEEEEYYYNVKKNVSLVKASQLTIGVSQYSLSLPICSSILEDVPCRTGTNTIVETCIHSNKIYKTQYGKCFLTYGYLPETGIKIFQKGKNSLDYKDVTGKMDTITLNANESHPYFVLYDCLLNQCIQTSGFVRYKLANSSEEMKDQFVACYSQSPIGCQKLEYATSDECSNREKSDSNINTNDNDDDNNNDNDDNELWSPPNEGKIKFTPVDNSSKYAELKICMDTSGKATGPKNFNFISISIDYVTERYFALYMGRTPFPDTLPEQNVFMRVTIEP